MSIFRTFFGIALLATLLGTLYYFRERVTYLLLPCQSPILYSIGAFDDRFGISKEQFADAILRAERIWEEPLQLDLFNNSEGGMLTVNLIYDLRQQSTQRLQTLGIVINEDEATYRSLKAKHGEFQSSYTRLKTELEGLYASYEQEKEAYEKEVSLWNSRGGAPKAKFDELNRQAASLKEKADYINQEKARLNELVADLNALVDVINGLAQRLNLNAERYNTIGAERGEEFEEGVYRSNSLYREIDIYQFDDTQKLIRVLAHELGHALGLEHLDDPQAIMYRLNQATNAKLSADDLVALKKKCRIAE